MYEHLACNIIKACGFPFYGVSGDVCSWLRTFGITAAGRLPNAVDPAELAQLASDHPRDFRAEFDLAPATSIIAFVGRLIPEKGAAKLAEAVRQLNQNGTSCALFIAGTGPEENALRQLGAPIYALGALPHPADRPAVNAGQLLLPADGVRRRLPHHVIRSRRLPLPHRHHPHGGHRRAAARWDLRCLLGKHRPCRAGRGPAGGPGRSRRRPHPADAAYTNLCAHFTWQAVFATMEKTAAQAAKRS